jgi:aldehyde:ferredoxin oxidoreductase
MITGWTGKRLRIDLTLQKAWVEEIVQADLNQWFGGRGLNAFFFSQHFQSPVSPSSPEDPIAFAVGPLTGTLAPCSGWTSIASFSPLSNPPGYAFTRMPGHFGAQLKWAGFDQCILQGKADRPVYLLIEDGGVKFEPAGSLWGKETTETTVAIQEQKGDRSMEILCIGPAGEKQIPFANVIHRLSWTADHLGLGYLFGVKQLKAMAIRGKKPVTLYDPQRFLHLCLDLKDRIQKDRKLSRLKEEGTFSLVVQDGEIMKKTGHRWLSSPLEKQWIAAYRKCFLSGKEGCFSCPVHCGRITQHPESYFGGIHLGKAWVLGPQIGVYDWEWTLKLHRLCQAQGLDPFATGSLLARIMEGIEDGSCSEEGLQHINGLLKSGEKAYAILHWILNGGGEKFHAEIPPVFANEDLDVLGDIISFCPLVVSRLNSMTISNIIDLIYAATAYSLSDGEPREVVRNILQMESVLHNKEAFRNAASSHGHFVDYQINKVVIKEERNNESVGYEDAS